MWRVSANKAAQRFCKFGRVPGGVGNLGPPRADFVISQAMICNARATGHFLAYRNLKAGCRPPRKPNGDADNANTKPEKKIPPVFAHSPRRAKQCTRSFRTAKAATLRGRRYSGADSTALTFTPARIGHRRPQSAWYPDAWRNRRPAFWHWQSVTSSLFADWNCLQVQVERSISFAFADAFHARIAAVSTEAAVRIARLKIIPRTSSWRLSPHRALSRCRLRQCAGNRPAGHRPARPRDSSVSPKLLDRGSTGSAPFQVWR